MTPLIFYRIQKKVLQRGLELLAIGGKLVYSTCSLNPVEDEAVILALIKQCGKKSRNLLPHVIFNELSAYGTVGGKIKKHL